MKRRWRRPQLSEEQQLILGLLLVILVVTSLLYCLGFASLALRQAGEAAPLPWSETEPPAENPEAQPTPVDVIPTPGATPLSREGNAEGDFDRMPLSGYNRLATIAGQTARFV